MVSISLSLRFHDMMAIVQGRNGLCRCVFAKVLLLLLLVVVFPVELPNAPTMTLIDGDAQAEVRMAEDALDVLR